MGPGRGGSRADAGATSSLGRMQSRAEGSCLAACVPFACSLWQPVVGARARSQSLGKSVLSPP